MTEEQIETIISSNIHEHQTQALFSKAQVLYNIFNNLTEYSTKITDEMINSLQSQEKNKRIECLFFFIIYFSHITYFSYHETIENTKEILKSIFPKLFEFLVSKEDENIQEKAISCLNQIYQSTYILQIPEESIEAFIKVRK